MMKNLLLILCFLPMFAFAQEEDNSKYMVGAVPEVSRMFAPERSTPRIFQNQNIFDAMKWANTVLKQIRETGAWLLIPTRKRDKSLVMAMNISFLQIKRSLWTGQTKLPDEFYNSGTIRIYNLSSTG